METIMKQAQPDVAAYYPRFRRSQMVADTLRGWISSGRLVAGDRLPTEQQLCKEFGVSRTTLREATQMLRTEGVLDVTPGRGSYVCRPSVLPRLQALTMAVRGDPGLDVGHAFELLAHVLSPMVAHICRRPIPARQVLLGGLLQPNLNGRDNAELERAWLVKLPEIAQAPMVALVCRVVLEVVAHEREAQLGDVNPCSRAAHAQLRTANALVQGDATVAGRLLVQYLEMASGVSIVGPAAASA